MKHRLFIGLLLSLGSQIQAQSGAEVSRDVRLYLESKKVESIDVVKSIEPRKSVEPSKTHVIGGQKVDEANSTVFKAFRMHPEWKNMVLVADCTASMYPYIGQILAWHQSSGKNKLLLDILLFNDGDDKIRNGKPKIVGNVGGLYWVNPDNINDLLKTLENAVNNGDGDDSQENDIEALLAAQKRHPKAKELVLIADNSPIRDMSLASQLRKPVHIIMCNGGWVGDYVQLAYLTGGSITFLTDHKDFSDKSKIRKDDININGFKYDLK
jgi:hypothetical protein